MSKVITIRLNDAEVEEIESLMISTGISNTSTLLKEGVKKLKDRRVILPKHVTDRDKLAKFLGIGELDKEYVLFQQRITEERVYDPHMVRPNLM